MIKFHVFTVTLLAVILSCGNSDSDKGLQSETGTETEVPSDIDVFMDDNGFESVNSANKLGETPLQVALNTENYAAAALLTKSGANDEVLYILDTNIAGLFKIGINDYEIQEISVVYGDVTLEEVDLMLEGMSAPAVEITFIGDSSEGLVLEIEPKMTGNPDKENHIPESELQLHKPYSC